MEPDVQYLLQIVHPLVENPDDVEVDRTVDEMGVLLTLSLNQEDMGKVIGREGATAKAIRTLLRVVGMKNGSRVNLKINEPEGSVHIRPKAQATQVREQRGEAPEMKNLDEAIGDL